MTSCWSRCFARLTLGLLNELMIPLLVWRPLMTRGAVGLFPIETAPWADSAGLERIPDAPAGR